MDDHEHTSRLEDRHLSPSSKLAHPSSESGVAVPTLPALCLGLSMGFSEAAPSTAGKRVFTFMQMQELEQQALIYKYMVAGLPVPLHLVLPIWKSVAASAYGSNYFPSRTRLFCYLTHLYIMFFRWLLIVICGLRVDLGSQGDAAAAYASTTVIAWTPTQADVGGPTARSGGARMTPCPSTSTVSATCTAAATVQESLWKQARTHSRRQKPRAKTQFRQTKDSSFLFVLIWLLSVLLFVGICYCFALPAFHTKGSLSRR
ncbi:hypothetical protein HPP92_022248 [Vanilla planifolia]|uniref:Growth-regulating factor n=1 Tax=Vanilla planifolia TaxID=51239 RepID=A0A835UF43_VANPL|nr:hypothetical protein HPP92_022248 [Vanilla planifolia]